MPKPKKVLEAIASGDSAALVAMGKAGGKRAGPVRALNEAKARERKEETLRGAREHAEAHRIAWDDDYKE